MEKLRRISNEYLNGEITGEEYYNQLIDTITTMAETEQADERMREIALHLAKF